MCILTTNGHCDCGTPLGAGSGYLRDRDHQREVDKLRKRGWSEARVQKWLAQKEGADDRKVRARSEAQKMDLEMWLAFIRSALGAVRRVGLLVGDYGGAVADEPLEVTRQTVAPLQLTAELLLAMQQDVVYEFTR